MSKPAPISALPRLFEAIDRAQTVMPEWYLPSAQFVLVAGPDLLGLPDQPKACPPSGRSRRASGYKKTARDGTTLLWVQRCGLFWIIERSIKLEDGSREDQALACAFGHVPFWARTREYAMRLAQHCDPIPQAPVAGFWMKVVQ